MCTTSTSVTLHSRTILLAEIHKEGRNGKYFVAELRISNVVCLSKQFFVNALKG
jgi:hypothetical protein